MTEIEKLRKRTRKNRKREIRAKYRYLMNIAKLEMENATRDFCYIKREHSENSYFALWLVAKKLEAKGFICGLASGEHYYSGKDSLRISWESE